MKLKKHFDLANFSATKIPLVMILTIFTITVYETIIGFGDVGLASHYQGFKNNDVIPMFLSAYYTENFFILLFSFLVGLLQFKFLDKKSLGITTFGFPVKRKKLFNEKTIFPLTFIIVIPLIFKIIAFFIARKYHLGNPDLITMCFVECLSIIQFALMGFTASVIASVFCGRTVETVLGAYSILSLPSTLFTLIDSLLGCYLYGYITRSDLFSSANPNITAWFAPTATRTILDIFFGMDIAPTANLSPMPIIFWIVVCIVLLFMCKKHFIKSLKPEQIGFKTINKVMTFIITVVLALTTSLFGAYTTFSSKYIFYDIADKRGFYTIILIIFTVVAAYIINCIISSSIKISMQKAITIIAPVALIGLTVLFGLTDGCGFAKRIPDAEKIESVEVVSTFNHLEPIHTSYSLPEFTSSSMPAQYPISFTTKNDINIAKAIHKSALENRNKETQESVVITYVLKNGRKISRSYSYLSQETSDELLSIWKSDRMGVLLKEVFFENKPTNLSLYSDDTTYHPIYYYYNREENEEVPFSCYKYKDSSVGLACKDGRIEDITPKIDERDFEIIKTAIYNDMTELSAEEWFTPTKTYGEIFFGYNASYCEAIYGFDLYEDEETEEIVTEEIVTEEFETEDGTGVVADVNGDEIDTAETETEEEIITYQFFNTFDDEFVAIDITAEMKHTIKALKDLGLFDILLKREATPKHMYIGNAQEVARWHNNFNEEQKVVDISNTQIFYGDSMLADDIICSLDYEEDEEETEDYYSSFVDRLISVIFSIEEYSEEPAPVTEITDKQEIENLLEKSHGRTYVDSKSKLLVVEYEDYSSQTFIINE